MEIIAIPLPLFQGHINPMLQLCCSLSSRGINVTLVLTNSVAKSMQWSQLPQSINGVNLAFIPDGSDAAVNPPITFDDWLCQLRAATSDGVAAVIEKRTRAKVLLHDSILPWLSDVGRERGLRVAALFTQPASVCCLYHHVIRGEVDTRRDDSTGLVCLPSLPEFEVGDLPCYSYFGDVEEQVADLNNKQASCLPNVDWFFINTFDALEEEVVKWMTEKWPVKTIGPLLPNIHNKITPSNNDEKQDRIDIFELEDEEGYMKWLDTREPKSVVYVSFGSMVAMSKEQTEEIAMVLAQSNKHFLWVVRESEDEKLPLDFKSKTSEKGLVVKWCRQVEVLLHRAIACFVTHCGWNSILEALCLSLPVVGFPHFADQPTVAKFVEDVWGVGFRVKVDDEKGVVTRDEIEGRIKEVMEGVRAEEFKRNGMKWKGLVEEATMEGGSSDLNIKDFISQLSILS